MEIRKKLGLQINNSVRQSLYRIMRTERIVAWVAMCSSIVVVIYAVGSFVFYWKYGSTLLYTLPVFVVFLVVSIFTLSGAREVEYALRSDNQSAFDEALSKWNMRGIISIGGYILLFILCIVLAIKFSVDYNTVFTLSTL